MGPHNRPLLLVEWAGFEQNSIRNAHFANIVQECPTAHMQQLFVTETHTGGNTHRQLGYPPGMPFCLTVTQIKCT